MKYIRKTIISINSVGSWSVCLRQAVLTRNPYRRGRLSTVNLLIKIGCFVKKKNIVLVGKESYMN
jgi:hypothetical protein